MNLIFLILLFFIFIIPLSLLKKIYSYDSPDYKIAKILNIIVCLFLMFYVSNEDEYLRGILTDFNSFKQKYLIEVGGINKWIFFINKIALMALHVYLVIIILNLSQRSKKYRKRFLYFLLIFVLIQSLDTYRSVFDRFELPMKTLLLNSLLTSLIVFLPIFLIYVSRPFKNMMNLDKDKRLEILKMEKNT